MKIRQHNLSTNSDSNQEPNLKHSKIVTRQAIHKSKTAVLKENVPINVQKVQGKGKGKENVEQVARIEKEKQKIVDHVDVYQKQIIRYLKSKQPEYRITSKYLRNHEHLTQQHRATFIKHFFKIGKKFQLKRNTIFLAVYYMDAYLEKNEKIDKREAMISALACLFIAMKYEEIYPPQLYEWTQPSKQIILAQSQILKALNFNLTYTTLQSHLQYNLHKLDIPDRHKEMITLVADVSLFDQSMYSYSPSELSLALIYSITCEGKLEEKMEMTLKWMLERNQKYMEWLQGMKMGAGRS